MYKDNFFSRFMTVFIIFWARVRTASCFGGLGFPRGTLWVYPGSADLIIFWPRVRLAKSGLLGCDLRVKARRYQVRLTS